jgi:CRP-like cAMP-binding protein
LERLLARFSYLQALHMAQIAACNRLHNLPERLARWLLMTQDRIQADRIPLTHEFLANMLGTRRSSVTITAGLLASAGVITYSRGKVRVLDRQKLAETACECYDVVRLQLDAYLKNGQVAQHSS